MAQNSGKHVSYEETSEKLLEYVPELRESYEAESRWWGSDKPGPHVVYGEVLNPYIDRLLESGDEARLGSVFAFLELLSCSADKRVQELVTVTVCEHLGTNPELLRKARRYMGPATLKHSEDVERFWNG